MHKGTSTDVVAEGKWPEITLEDAQNDGNVKFQMNWADYAWGADKEQTEPEFDILAKGYHTVPAAMDSKVEARIGSFKVKFIRQCVLDVPAGP